MREHCQDLGSAAELEAVEDLLSRGNGAARQVVVYEANHDLREVMAEIVAATHAPKRLSRPGARRAGLGAVLQSVRERRRPRSVRDLQELRIRGQSRTSPSARTAAIACASGRPSSTATAAWPTSARAARRRRCYPAAPRRDPRDPARHPPLRDDRAGPLGLVGTLLWRTGLGGTTSWRSSASPAPHWWRLFTAAFTYDNTGYAFVDARRDRPLRLAAGAPPRAAAVLGLFLVGGVGGLAATAAVYHPVRAGRQRRRAGAAVRLGGPRPARAAGRRGHRRRPARDRGDRDRGRADAAGGAGRELGRRRRSAWWPGSRSGCRWPGWRALSAR